MCQRNAENAIFSRRSESSENPPQTTGMQNQYVIQECTGGNDQNALIQFLQVRRENDLQYHSVQIDFIQKQQPDVIFYTLTQPSETAEIKQLCVTQNPKKCGTKTRQIILYQQRSYTFISKKFSGCASFCALDKYCCSMAQVASCQANYTKYNATFGSWYDVNNCTVPSTIEYGGYQKTEGQCDINTYSTPGSEPTCQMKIIDFVDDVFWTYDDSTGACNCQK
ncbi:Hypothetical_protein [Hexamita inflata]|uniref:Hypothetical_protein n=1 Tax=Hexamita inflata TaxID=28002 RepID=A0AA86N4M5_9EUKA|nr:Hypothetical protein HINF_LOCUS388 [Hexamita inflata]